MYYRAAIFLLTWIIRVGELIITLTVSILSPNQTFSHCIIKDSSSFDIHCYFVHYESKSQFEFNPFFLNIKKH